MSRERLADIAFVNACVKEFPLSRPSELDSDTDGDDIHETLAQSQATLHKIVNIMLDRFNHLGYR